MTHPLVQQLVSVLVGLLILLAPTSVSAEPLSRSPVLHHPISTHSAAAQRYFDEGLLLTYGFNYPEALRSFQAAVNADPNCAMCYWGMAYNLRQNIDADLAATGTASGRNAIQKALILSEAANAAERDYIQALAQRYLAEPGSDRAVLNRYANAMRQVAHQYPDDPDAGTLFAEALMDTTPWHYWEDTDELTPVGREIVATLKSVLERNPNHPGALHFYIHTVEEKHPEWAISVADRLQSIHLATGHLAHMPAHIYIRVGRYQDAVTVNQQAVAVDSEYARSHVVKGVYHDALMPHNHHFLWYAATQAGQKQVALQAAAQTAAMVDPELARQPGYGMLQHFLVLPLYTFVQFGQWDQVLAQPAPATDLLYPSGVWRYARGMAFVAQHQLQNAAQELHALRAIANNPTLETVTLWEVNSTQALLQIGVEVLAGKLAAQQGNTAAAIDSLQHAVELEDRLHYDEPPPWPISTRRTLASTLLEAGRPAEAEQVYRDDLNLYPNNGWSLYGLASSLEAQGETEAAQTRRQQFQAAWAQSDQVLSPESQI